MCGVFTNRLPGVGPREWNALQDSGACRAVYRAPVAVHRSIGLDVTMQVRLKFADAVERFRAAGGPLDEQLTENVTELMLRGFAPSESVRANAKRKHKRPR